MKKLLYILLAISAIFTSCKKGELVESTPYTKINAADPAYSYLRFINITPGSPNVNFYLNSTRVTGAYNALSGETGFGYLGFFPNLGGQYLPITPGKNTIEAKIISSATVDPNLNVFNTPIETTGGKYYSLLTTGTYTTDKKISNSFLLEEVKPLLDTTKILVRLVNLFNGGTANIDMVQKSTGQVLISNIAQNGISPYVSIPLPGQANVYAFNYTGTATSPAPTYTVTATLTKGQAYTFFVRGINGSTAFPFGTSYTASFY